MNLPDFQNNVVTITNNAWVVLTCELAIWQKRKVIKQINNCSLITALTEGKAFLSTCHWNVDLRHVDQLAMITKLSEKCVHQILTEVNYYNIQQTVQQAISRCIMKVNCESPTVWSGMIFRWHVHSSLHSWLALLSDHVIAVNKFFKSHRARRIAT